MCLILLLSSYKETRCDCIHRSANDIAHILVISAHSELGQRIWVHISPFHIISLIAPFKKIYIYA